MSRMILTWFSIAVLAIGTLLSAWQTPVSAQLASSPSSSITAANETTMEINRLQSLIVQTAVEDQSIGNDMRISHRWSNITEVPVGKTISIIAYCDKGSFALGEGYQLGSPNLQVTGSHLIPENATTPAGWMVTVSSQNSSSPPTPAAASVLCLSTSASTSSNSNSIPQSSSQSQEQQAPETVEPKQSSSSQAEGLTVATDHESYSRGDTIKISGTVADRKPGATVLVEVTDPHSDQVWLESVTVTSNNNYEMTLEAGHRQYSFSEHRMEAAGTYLVTASYFDPDNDLLTSDTSFKYEP